MSKSHKGTKKTSSFINNSPKYIERSNIGRTKFGSIEEKTDAGHKFSYGLLNVIETHSPGAPKSPETKQEINRAMNSNDNIRIKGVDGNRIKDERRDARIADAIVNHKYIQGKSTIDRVVIAYNATKGLPDQKYAEKLGNMRVENTETGGYPKLKNLP